MLKLLLDENISPALTGPLWERGVDTVALRDRGLLEVGDHTVWAIGQQEARSVVTINYGDFRRLAQRATGHAGLVIIPSGRTRDGQFNLIVSVIEFVRSENVESPSLAGRIFDVAEDGKITVDGAAETSVPTSRSVHTTRDRSA